MEPEQNTEESFKMPVPASVPILEPPQRGFLVLKTGIDLATPLNDAYHGEVDYGVLPER